MEEKKDLNLIFLNEIVKLCKMGMSSITFVVNKMKKRPLKDTLNSQYLKFQTFLENTLKLFEEYQIEPEKFEIEEDMIIWPGVKFTSLTGTEEDDYISDLFLQGNYVAAATLHKRFRLDMNLKPEVKKLLDDFLALIDVNIKDLRVFFNS